MYIRMVVSLHNKSSKLSSLNEILTQAWKKGETTNALGPGTANYTQTGVLCVAVYIPCSVIGHLKVDTHFARDVLTSSSAVLGAAASASLLAFSSAR